MLFVFLKEFQFLFSITMWNVKFVMLNRKLDDFDGEIWNGYNVDRFYIQYFTVAKVSTSHVRNLMFKSVCDQGEVKVISD
jgi:hypothetical protein